MPGLYCPSSWTPLPLTDSWVRACANGPCLSLRARLTYHNPQPQPVDGVFVYPLAEAEVVSGFEAEAAGRRVSFQLQSRRRQQAACCRALGPGLGAPTPRRCAQGHLVLDLAQARSALVVPTGLIAAAGTVTVTLRSSRELPARPDGVLCVALPSVLTPLALPGPPGPPRPPGLCDDSPTSCFGVSSPQEHPQAPEEPAAPQDVFSGPAHCPAPYTFSFEMLVTGPCLLAGLESPSHALRADAPPHASSAATICVTLAEGHHCDRALEILLYPSEPHRPHLMLEAGSLSSAAYEAQVRARRDFQRMQRRDRDGDRQVWFLQRRFHKDILLNPVLVLSFCPDLSAPRGPPGTATRELLFLLDGAGAEHKDAVVLAMKSVPQQTLVNMATFCASSVQALFPESRPCGDDTVRQVCRHLETLRAAPGAPDVQAALGWALGQPLRRAHPRQLFLLTAAKPTAASTHHTLELLRGYPGAARCFSFGLGPGGHQLLRSLAALSRGQAYFLRPGERLQPMLVQALRKALEPALTDVSVDWFVPDGVEALLTPREIPALYPGDQLLGYCALFRVDSFRARTPGGQEPGWQSLGGSVFPSPEEPPSATSPGTEPTGTSEPPGTGNLSAELSSRWAAGDSQSTDALTDPATDPGPNPSSDTAIWRRIFQSSYIREQYVLTHCSASPEPGPGSMGSSESPGSQGPGSPEGSGLPEPPSQQGCRNLAWGEAAGSRSCPLPLPPPPLAPIKAEALSTQVMGRHCRAALAGRSLSSPAGRVNPAPGRPRTPSLGAAPDETGQLLGPGLDDSGNLLSPAPLDWDMLLEPPFLFTAVGVGGEPPPPAALQPTQAPRCHVVVRALCGEQPLCWEVGIGLETLWGPVDNSPPPLTSPEREGAWDQALHRLAAASVVRDNEQLAVREGREATADQGRARRACLRALQTSKVSLAPSCYTCPVAVDAATREVLPLALQVWSSEPPEPPSSPLASQGCRDAGPMPAAAPSEGLQGSQGPGQDGTPEFASGIPEGGSPGLPPQHGPRCPQAKGAAGHDYLPLVRLQEAPGCFRLDAPFCAAVSIPQERLCRASPFAAHRASLGPTSASSPWALLGPSGQGDSATASCSRSPSSGSEGPGQVDSGRGSDTEASEGAEGPGGIGSDLRGRTWATAVALAWLEHRCASAFGEWELAAAKADSWLRAQRLPDGLNLVALKAAAQGLFLLLRHWDQNLQLHLLCYSPANV